MKQGISCLDEDRRRVLSFHRCWLYSTFPLLLRGLFKYSLQFTCGSRRSLTISSFFFPFFFDPCCFQSWRSLFSPAFHFPLSNTNRFQTAPAHLPVAPAQGLDDAVPKLSLLPPYPFSMQLPSLLFSSLLHLACTLLSEFLNCISSIIPNCCFWRVEIFIIFHLPLHRHSWVTVSHTLT